MRLDLYLQETRRLAAELCALLDEVQQRLQNNQVLSKLEEAGSLHALQVLTENAIGKAKMILKSAGETVPVSAYDAFARLHSLGHIDEPQLCDWTAAIGLRNRIVHEYLNVDMPVVHQVILKKLYKLQVQFLLADFPAEKS